MLVTSTARPPASFLPVSRQEPDRRDSISRSCVINFFVDSHDTDMICSTSAPPEDSLRPLNLPDTITSNAHVSPRL
ncbi:unnamed protein product [Soboliphyme baturini]|uniref:Uncharacterized protein n=1 Tax=Soboliphyme baturini TaxID=241478 RepID=A0A183IUP4_9BILA|nr:unnamed protein product [Soboliphyme baturini]